LCFEPWKLLFPATMVSQVTVMSHNQAIAQK
jgi:hypothetical protein